MQVCHINLASGFYGGENQTLLMIKKQIEIGFQVLVVCKKGSPFAISIKSLNCNKLEISHFLFGHVSSISYNFDVIHVHEGKALYWALIQNLLRNKKYIVTRRIDNPLKNRALLKIGYNRASYLVGISQKIKEVMHEKFPNKRIRVIPSSPDKKLPNRVVFKNIKELTKGQFVVIQVGKLIKMKGHKISIEAAKKIKKIIPNAHFYFLGNGPEEPELKALIGSADYIHLKGYQNDTASWYRVSDIQIHPSLNEGLGSAILEGLANVTNVIASNVGGIPDIIQDKKNGLLCKPNNAEDLFQKIKYLYENKYLIKNFSVNNREILRTFDINNTCQAYKILYDLS